MAWDMADFINSHVLSGLCPQYFFILLCRSRLSFALKLIEALETYCMSVNEFDMVEAAYI